MNLPSHYPKLVNVGRQHLDADALDAPVGVRLRDLPGGPVSAMVVVIAGTAFEAPNARYLRMVAAMPGAAVDVFLLAPAEANKAA